MQIGIVSDIHGNIAGLDHALARMGAVDALWCAGDAFTQDEFSNAVVARLKDRGARYILGNHEETLLHPASFRAQESASVDQELLAWVRRQPTQITECIDGLNIHMFHSTPWEPSGDYLYPHSQFLHRLGDLDADVAIYGHTHTKIAREINGTLVLNPGSAGIGRPSNDRQLSYAILDTVTRDVVFDDFDDPGLP